MSMRMQCLLLTVAALLIGCGGGTAERGARNARPGDTVSAKKVTHAEFELDTLDGRKLGPAEFRGRVVLVDFWATWCLPCKAQAKLLEAAYPRYSRDDVQFLAVNVSERKDVVKKYVGEHPFPYPVLLDPDGTTSDQFNLVALPSLMIINPTGKVTYFRAGLIGRKDLEDLLRDAGAEPIEVARSEERG
jgi:cytochrome c biogenesis protein CcmG/thiol:disulfide interchange protein DsbE